MQLSLAWVHTRGILFPAVTQFKAYDRLREFGPPVRRVFGCVLPSSTGIVDGPEPGILLAFPSRGWESALSEAWGTRARGLGGWPNQ